MQRNVINALTDPLNIRFATRNAATTTVDNKLFTILHIIELKEKRWSNQVSAGCGKISILRIGSQKNAKEPPEQTVDNKLFAARSIEATAT